MRNLPWLLLVLAMVSGHAAAQSVEAEWRVTNEVSPTVVPLYKQQANPFPVREEVKVEMEEPLPEDQVAAEAQYRAGVIARARDLLNSNKVFKPDTSSIVFDAYLKTGEGERVLYDDNWLAIGESIDAPVKGAQEAYDTIREVENVDADMAKTLRDELQTRLSSASTIAMKIIAITEENVVVSGGGTRLVVEIRQGGL